MCTMIYKDLDKKISPDLNNTVDNINIKPKTLISPTVTYIISVKKWRLEQSFSYQHNSNCITVPDQFEFDLASIPRPFWWLIAPFELSISAPLIHDFLYRFHGAPPSGFIVPPRTYTRFEADTLFREMMKQEGVGLWRRVAAYLVVRCFGWNTWLQNKQSTCTR